MTKQYGVDFVISAEVANHLDESWHLRPLDRIRVKGKAKPVMVFEVIGKEGGVEKLDSEKLAWCRKFSDAFDSYQQGQFDEARPAV